MLRSQLIDMQTGSHFMQANFTPCESAKEQRQNLQLNGKHSTSRLLHFALQWGIQEIYERQHILCMLLFSEVTPPKQTFCMIVVSHIVSVRCEGRAGT